jgi:hypothetical protein
MFFKKKGLLFSHIPKTAGTSFRKSVARFAFTWTVHGDYGPDNKSTSSLIKHNYANDDFSNIEELTHKKTLLAGHYPINKYVAYYPLYNIISFVRDPVQRVISHYHDLQGRINYSGSLEEYASEPRFQNVQSGYFKDIPVEAVGFIGICEFYEESLEMIRKMYRLHIPIRKYNRNKNKREASYITSEEMAAFIREMNSEDCALYEKAMKIFLLRQELIKNNQPYIYGKITIQDEDHIKGWAVNPLSSSPVKLTIKVNDQTAGNIIADQPTEEFSQLDIGRNGEIGFCYNFQEKLRPDDIIEVRVIENAQLILN